MRATDRFVALALAATVLGLLCRAAPAQGPGRTGQPRVLVADVFIQGSKHIPVEQLMARIKTRAEQEYNAAAIQDDVRTLNDTRQFKNVWANTRQESDGRVTVFFFVQEYPNLVEEVVFQGAKHIKPEDLEKLTGIRKGGPLSPNANEIACRRIVQKLNDEGRPFASCDLLSGSQPGDTKVIFNITEDPKTLLRGVSFCGNDWASSGRLMAQINTKPILGLFPTKYHPDAIETDIIKIKEYYHNFGFLDIGVSREVQMTEDGRDLLLTYHISEGKRYTIQGVQLDGNHAVPTEQLDQLVTATPGQFYSQTEVDNNVTKLKDYIGYTGRMSNVHPQVVTDKNNPGVVRVIYQVDERPPARVGQIFIVGNERTKQKVIMRQLPLYPGQLLTYPDLRNAERNLQRLNIFDTSQDGSSKPTVTVVDAEGLNPVKDILVSVQEANTGSLVFGVGVNSNSGLNGSIVLNERNFDIMRPPTSFADLLSGNAWRGAGQQFQINAMPGTQLQRYSVSWTEPFLFETPNSLTTTGYYYTRMYNEYNEQRVGGRVTLARRLTAQWTVSGSQRAEDVDINGVVDFAPIQISQYVGSNFVAGSRGNIIFDTRDSYLRPTSGTVVDLGYEQCYGTYTFPLAAFTGNKYFTLFERPDGSGRHVLSIRSQVSYAGPDTPVFERFYAGGFGSIRGFQFRGVSPDINGFKIGGDFMVLNSFEYQMPVLANDQFFVVAFCDTGTVESNVEITNYRVAVGFGVRFAVPMLGPAPIALDFGFPLHKAPTDITQVFSFSMGFTH